MVAVKARNCPFRAPRRPYHPLPLIVYNRSEQFLELSGTLIWVVTFPSQKSLTRLDSRRQPCIEVKESSRRQMKACLKRGCLRWTLSLLKHGFSGCTVDWQSTRRNALSSMKEKRSRYPRKQKRACAILKWTWRRSTRWTSPSLSFFRYHFGLSVFSRFIRADLLG